MSRLLLTAALTLAQIDPAAAQATASDAGTIDLVVRPGTALRIALDARTTVTRIGQRVSGTIVEPVFAYDRVVIPPGTIVRGHIARLENAPTMTRVGAVLGGDLTPPRHVVLVFDTLLLRGEEIPIETIVTGGTQNAKRVIAAGAAGAAGAGGAGGAAGAAGSESSKKRGLGTRAREEAKGATQEFKQQARDTLSMIKQPGRFARLRDAILGRLPYHRQHLNQGTIYSAELVTPLEFGAVPPIERAPAGTEPAPGSILAAQLLTPLDSSKTPRGTAITAVLTAPVFSADHRLILPQGTSLTGEVTFARQASHFHRNGQLRFLFERVEADSGSSELLASLYSVQGSGNDHLAVDNEGGTSITNSKLRFVAPVLAMLALRATGETGTEAPEVGAAGATIETGNVGGRALGGFMGFGLIGAAVGQVSRPVAWGLALVGAARTVYTSTLGKGQNVSFPAHTPIEVQLAPGSRPDQ